MIYFVLFLRKYGIYLFYSVVICYFSALYEGSDYSQLIPLALLPA